MLIGRIVLLFALQDTFKSKQVYMSLEADQLDREPLYTSPTQQNMEVCCGVHSNLPSSDVRVELEDVSMPVHHHEKVH